MAKPIAGEMIVLHLDDQLGFQGFPFRGALRAPAAGSTRRIACEPRWSDKLLEAPSESWFFLAGECRREPDVMKQARPVIQAEQEGSDLAAVAFVTKAAHDTIGRAAILDLQHGALAGAVGQVQAFGDNPIKGCLAVVEPLFGVAQLTGDGRQPETMGVADSLKEPFERLAALREGLVEQRLARLEQQAIEEDQGGRRVPGKAIDAALRRMQPHLQRIERHLAIDRNDEFAVKHERRVRERA